MAQWVAEKLVRRAAEEAGLPVTIHRPGRVLTAYETGASNTDDEFGAPADRVASAVVALSLDAHAKSTYGGVYNPEFLTEVARGISERLVPFRNDIISVSRRTTAADNLEERANDEGHAKAEASAVFSQNINAMLALFERMPAPTPGKPGAKSPLGHETPSLEAAAKGSQIGTALLDEMTSLSETLRGICGETMQRTGTADLPVPPAPTTA